MLIFGVCGTSFGLEIPAIKFIMCQQNRGTGKHIRLIKIHKISDDQGDRYITVYTRQGKDAVVAQGKWLMFCDKKADQIKNNLEKALWRCQSADSVKVFYSHRFQNTSISNSHLQTKL